MPAYDHRGPRPRLLVFAYACEPGRGSEPGAGWGMVQALSSVADCVVLVGPSHADAIAAWERARGPSQSLSFVVVPDDAGPKHRTRPRLGWLRAYLKWLPRAAAAAHDLHAERPFDAVCHATYSTYWLPTPGIRLGIPCLWGPVGGGVVTPFALWRALGVRGVVTELLDLLGVRAFAALPATRRTWRDVAWPVVQNRATLSRLPVRMRDRATLLNHALFTQTGPVPARRPGRHLLFAGGLETRKGLWLVLSALARTPPTVSLIVAGGGPESRRLERLARRLGIANRVEFRGQVARPELMDLFATAAASVFAGLREEGGLALAEAMLCWLPGDRARPRRAQHDRGLRDRFVARRADSARPHREHEQESRRGDDAVRAAPAAGRRPAAGPGESPWRSRCARPPHRRDDTGALIRPGRRSGVPCGGNRTAPPMSSTSRRDGRDQDHGAGRPGAAEQRPAEPLDDARHRVEAVERAPALGDEAAGVGDRASRTARTGSGRGSCSARRGTARSARTARGRPPSAVTSGEQRGRAAAQSMLAVGGIP